MVLVGIGLGLITTGSFLVWLTTKKKITFVLPDQENDQK